MKVELEIECTPEEARAFFGLPNIAPMQDRMMKEMEDRILENIRNLDPETLVNTWMPMTINSWNEMQKMFWSQMGQSMPNMPGMPGFGTQSGAAAADETKAKKPAKDK